MEAIITILQSPGGTLTLEVIAIGGLIYLMVEGRKSRKSIHQRVDDLRLELNGRVDVVQKNQNDHDVKCAERWGIIKTLLKIKDED